jgi:hypothetical protein
MRSTILESAKTASSTVTRSRSAAKSPWEQVNVSNAGDGGARDRCGWRANDPTLAQVRKLAADATFLVTDIPQRPRSAGSHVRPHNNLNTAF